MQNYDIIIKNANIVLPFEVIKGDIGIKEEKIVSIGDIYGSGIEEYDVRGRYVFPGVIDAHTHFELPLGRAISRDTFYSGSIAAVFGGVTTFIDFVNVDPHKRLVELLRERISQAKDAVIDYTFHSTIIGWKDERREEIREVIKEGVTSFKFFTAYGESGRRTDDGMLYSAFSEIKRQGALATVHAENDELVAFFSDKLKREGKTLPDYYPLSRPHIVEVEAIRTVLGIAKDTGVRVYIVHISTGEGAKLLREAKEKGQDVYGETTPHYLVLDDSFASRYISVCPPLRKRKDNELLWKMVKDEVISTVATDHCPFKKEDKDMGDTIWDIPYGLPGVETLFPIIFTYARRCDIPYPQISRLLSFNPSKIFGLYPGKGALYPGFDADIIVVNERDEIEVSPEKLHMNSDYNPYEGFRLLGFPEMVFSRGKLIVKDRKFLGEKGKGRFLKRFI